MKTYDEMVNSLLERREQYLVEQRQKRRTALEITYAGGCCALAAVFGIGFWNSGMRSKEQPLDPDRSPSVSDGFSSENKPQDPDYSSVIWGEDGNEFILSVEYEFSDFYGKQIYPSISKAFEKYGGNEVFAIAAVCDYDMSFVYNGKTLAQYKAELEVLWNKYEAFSALYKAVYYNGEDEEQYGGVNAEYYNELISGMDKALVSEYFEDGVFLKDKFDKDTIDLKEQIDALNDIYEQAREACNSYLYETAAEQIKAQVTDYKTRYGMPIIFATKDEFAALTFDGMQNWVFAMALEYDDFYYDGVIDHNGTNTQ